MRSQSQDRNSQQDSASHTSDSLGDVTYSDIVKVLQKSVRNSMHQLGLPEYEKRVKIMPIKFDAKVVSFIKELSALPTTKILLLSSYSSIHSHFMSSVFTYKSSRLQTFSTSWESFYNSYKLFIAKISFDPRTLLNELERNISDSSVSIKIGCSALKNIFIEEISGNTPMDTLKMLQKAIAKFLRILNKASGLDSAQSIMNQLSDQFNNIILVAEMNAFLAKTNHYLTSYSVRFQTEFSKPEKLQMAQSALDLQLIFVHVAASVPLNIRQQISISISKLKNIMNYIANDNHLETLAEYVKNMNYLTSIKPGSDEEAIKFLEAAVNAHQPDTCGISTLFSQFTTTRQSAIQEISRTSQIIFTILHKFLEFLNVYIESPYFDKSTETSIYNILISYSIMIITKKFSNDSKIIADFVNTRASQRHETAEYLEDIIESAIDLEKTGLISAPYRNFFGRYILITKIFLTLLRAVNPSQVQATVQSFSTFYPNIFKIGNLIEVPSVQIEGSAPSDLGDPSSYSYDQMLGVISECVARFSIAADLSSASDYFDKLGKVARFVSCAQAFYSVNASQPTEFAFLIEPNRISDSMQSLMEALLPVFEDPLSRSPTLMEKSFSVSLTFIYEVYATESVALLPLTSLLPALKIPQVPTTVVSQAHVLRSLGRAGVPPECVEEACNALQEILELRAKDAGRLEVALNQIEAKYPTKPILKELYELVEKIKLYSSVSSAVTRAYEAIDCAHAISDSLIEIMIVDMYFRYVEEKYPDAYSSVGELPDHFWGYCGRLFGEEPPNFEETPFSDFAAIERTHKQECATFLLDMIKAVPTDNTLSPMQLNVFYSLCFVYMDAISNNDELQLSFANLAGHLEKQPAAENYDDYLMDIMVEVESIIKALSALPKSFEVESAIDDMLSFISQTADYVSMVSAKRSIATIAKALANCPPSLHPTVEVDPGLCSLDTSFAVDRPAPAQRYDYSYAFERLKKEAEFAPDEFKQMVSDFENKLNSLVFDVEPRAVENHFLRSMNVVNTTGAKLRMKVEDLSARIDHLRQNSKSSLSPVDINTYREQSEEYARKIAQLEATEELRRGDIAMLKEQLNEKTARLKEARSKLSIDALLPDGVTLSDLDATINSLASPHGVQLNSKSLDMLRYARDLQRQNIRLRSALKRTEVLAQIPQLGGEETEVPTDLEQEKEALESEIKELETVVGGSNAADVYDELGIEPLEVPQGFTDFIAMTSMVRSGATVRTHDFLALLDEAEKYVYDMSENRRQLSAACLEKD